MQETTPLYRSGSMAQLNGPSHFPQFVHGTPSEVPQAKDWWRKDLEDEVDEEMIEIKSKYISF